MSRRPGARPAPPPQLPSVHLARDHHRSTVSALVRDGTWVRVRPGASIHAALLTGDAAERRRTTALARIAALRTQLGPDVVVSHASAALLWGLPTLRTPTSTHVIQSISPRSGASPGVVRHTHALDPADVTVLHGVRVTTLERTAVDCAMTEPIRGGVVVMDAALHRGVDRARLEALLARMAARRGVVRARSALELADDGAESAGESLARVALLRVGLPRPTTQVEVSTPAGTFWGDLGWPEHRVLAEYDGRGKYGDSTADVVLAEKRREDALLDVGWRLLRLTAADLDADETLHRRVRHLLPGVRLTPRLELGL